LDIGAWDGNFSFAAQRHGAVRVLATDHFCWSGAGWGTKDGFDFANGKMKAGVESLEIDVPDISPEHVGTFDVVLFLGVLYHLRHPLLGLERAADESFAPCVSMVDSLGGGHGLARFRHPSIRAHEWRVW
jgi:tRNA (mo5U34)-methyltransferase